MAGNLGSLTACFYPKMGSETGNSGQRGSSSGQRHAKKSSHAGAGEATGLFGGGAESWPALPQPLKAGTLAMIRAAGG